MNKAERIFRTNRIAKNRFRQLYCNHSGTPKAWFYRGDDKKKQEKQQLTNETFDSRPSDRMSLGINNNDTLDDSYIPGAY
jgi:hypothetical protein